jgi:hypothetical protein
MAAGYHREKPGSPLADGEVAARLRRLHDVGTPRATNSRRRSPRRPTSAMTSSCDGVEPLDRGWRE